MAEEATVPPKLPRLTQATFWSKTLDEKKTIFAGIHPSQHGQFFNNLGNHVRTQADPDKKAAMQADLSALKQHQQETQGTASLAMLIGRANQGEERTGLAGAAASGQPVAMFHMDEHGSTYHFRAVAPANVKNYLSSLPKSIEKVHVVHRRAGSSSEPAHTTELRRSRMGYWEEVAGSHEVHDPNNLTPSAPYIPFSPLEKRKREKAESETAGRLREAIEDYPVSPQLPSIATVASPRTGAVHTASVDWASLVGNVGRSGAEHLHNVLMKDPDYAARFHERAERFGGAQAALEAAAAGHAESIQKTEEIQSGRRLRYSRGVGNVDLPAIEEGLSGAQGGGALASGGPPANTPVSAQGTVWARPLDHEDAMIHDVAHLARAVMHGSSHHLLHASPDIPEFSPTEIPEVGAPGVGSADDRNIAARNLGVRDAKASEHVQGMLDDINGTAVHPAYINNFPVHHYISKVAAEAGVDTDEGRLQAILDNAHARARERQQEWLQGPAIGVTAAEHLARSASGAFGTPIVRSHAARDISPGTLGERFYREGLHRTAEAALAEYGHHLATSDFSVMPSSGELAYHRAREAAANRNGVPMMPDAPNEDETLSAPPPDLVAEQRQEHQERKGAANSGRIPDVEYQSREPTEASEGAKVQLQGTHLPSASRVRDLEEWASNFLEGTPTDPDKNAKAYLAVRRAHPSMGSKAQFAGQEEEKK